MCVTMGVTKINTYLGGVAGKNQVGAICFSLLNDDFFHSNNLYAAMAKMYLD